MFLRSASRWLPVIALIGSPGISLGHELRLLVDVEGTEIVGRVSYQGGSPASGTFVQILNPRRDVVAETSADAEGRFRQSMEFRSDYLVRARTLDLHQAERVVNADQFPSALPLPKDDPPRVSSPKSKAEDEAFRRDLLAEIRLLREQLDRVEGTIGLRDIVGGIGYLVGILGLFLFLRQRSK